MYDWISLLGKLATWVYSSFVFWGVCFSVENGSFVFFGCWETEWCYGSFVKVTLNFEMLFVQLNQSTSKLGLC